MPTKVAYLEIEENDDIAFEFFLGEKLGKSIAEIRELDNLEFMRWGVWFARKAQQKELAQKQGG